jgi:hypothetical protein
VVVPYVALLVRRRAGTPAAERMPAPLAGVQ